MRPALLATVSLLVVLAGLPVVPSGTAGGASIVVIELSCFGFHPEVAEVRNVDIIRFTHADACGNNPHSVTATGTTGDPAQDLNKPAPTSPFVGECFNSSEDLLAFLTPSNGVYELDLDLVLAVAVRDMGSANPRQCLGANSVMVDQDDSGILGIVPYHCQLHGGNQDPGSGMRGALVIRA